MRRLLSTVLLLLFSLPLISPLFALAAGSDVNLPACCRRNGAHHCTTMTRAPQLPGGVNLSAIPQCCPAYPAIVAPERHGHLSFQTESLIFAEIVSHPAIRPQTQACARVALDRSRQKRGPPLDLL